MTCLKEKCIHHDVCALYTFSGYASDECGFYETRPHGEWIKGRWESCGALTEDYYNCSECGHETTWRTNYCSKCGSDNRPRGTEK